MLLNIPGVIHLFVALLGPILGVLLGILVSPKTLMEILVGGVGEPLNLLPTYDFSSCFFPKFKIMHFQNHDIKLYTVVLLFLCFLKFLLKLCCR